MSAEIRQSAPLPDPSAVSLLRDILPTRRLALQGAGYGVRMRDTSSKNVDTWAPYVQDVLDRAQIGKTELAARVGIKRQHVYRWLSGDNVPEAYDTIAAVAAVVGDDVSAALRAAGQERPAPSYAPIRDQEIAMIQASNAPQWLKNTLIQHVLSQRTVDEQRRREYVEGVLRDAGRIKP